MVRYSESVKVCAEIKGPAKAPFIFIHIDSRPAGNSGILYLWPATRRPRACPNLRYYLHLR